VFFDCELISMKKIVLSGFFLIVFSCWACEPSLTDIGLEEEPDIIVPDTASYTVTFNATWSSETHPDHFPPNAHFSSVAGAVHNETVSFWQVDSNASEGVKQISEEGLPEFFLQEVSNAVDDSTAFSAVESEGINSPPGTISFEIQVTRQFPLVTLISMIAPSPDWFTGVSRQNLFSDGDWIENLQADLLAYDAGTDSGEDFTSPDSATIPQQPVSLLDFGADSLNKFGEIIFERNQN